MSYSINTPIDFVNTNGGTDTLNFNADGPTANTQNKIENFVVTTAGDILYRASGGNNYIERLSIGTTDQVLTVIAGLPSWQTSGAQDVFTAFIIASPTGIPTSRDGGASPGTWFNLNNTYVNWSTGSPGTDADGVFTIATGLFTAPDSGIYQFSALITFTLDIGVNSGAGITTDLPSGTACRQVQIYNVTTATPISTDVRQVEASNSNGTVCSLSTGQVEITSGDTVVIRVRHDLPGTNTLSIGNVDDNLSSQNYFSGRLVFKYFL